MNWFSSTSKKKLRYRGPAAHPKQFQPRKWGEKLLFWGLTGLLVLVIGQFTLSCLHEGLGRSDFFRITTIQIQGNRQVTKNQILELSGVDFQTNLLAMETARVERALLSHPWIDRVKVIRNWPNQLLINVKENVPVAMINRPDGLFYLNSKGEIFTEVAETDNLDFPVLTGLNGSLPEISEMLKEALAFLKRSQKSTFLPKQNISEIHFDQQKGLVLFLLDRTFPIYLGNQEISRKHGKLARVLKNLYQKNTFEKTTYIRLDYLKDRVLVGSL